MVCINRKLQLTCFPQGGVKAVVYTDVFQALVMLAGVLAIVIIGSLNVGGLDVVWDIAYHHNRTELFK